MGRDALRTSGALCFVDAKQDYNLTIFFDGIVSEFIRGVNSDGPMTRLAERGLIEECGRLDAPGRPILYRTTKEFLRSFGLNSISDLPDISELAQKYPYIQAAEETGEQIEMGEELLENE